MIFDIHAFLGPTTFYYASILAIWAIWRMIRKQGVDSTFWGALVIAEILIFAQGILGLYLYFFSGLQLANKIHILFGALSAIVLPVAYALTRGNQRQRDMITYGVTFILMALLTLGALLTRGQLLVFK